MKSARPAVSVEIAGHRVIPAGGSYEDYDVSSSIIYDPESKQVIGVFDGWLASDSVADELARLFAESPDPRLIVQPAVSRDLFVSSVARHRSEVPVLKVERGFQLDQHQKDRIAELLDIHIL
jgi:hypothetical protein